MCAARQVLFDKFEGLATTIARDLWNSWMRSVAGKLDLTDFVQTAKLCLWRIAVDVDICKTSKEQAAYLRESVRRDIDVLRESVSDYVPSLAQSVMASTRGSKDSYTDDLALRVDVDDVLVGLTGFDQYICGRLSAGDSVSEIARAVGASVHRIRRRVEFLKEAFRGLNNGRR